MIEFFEETLGLIQGKIFLISVLIFFLGYALAPTACYKKINVLTVYPLWLAKKMEELSQKTWNPFVLFFFLLSMNSLSLFLSLLSGLVPILPFLFAVLTGLNLGVVTYHTFKGQYYYAALLNPVAFFELPAAFLTFTLAIQFNLMLLPQSVITIPMHSFQTYLNIFVLVVIPLLLIAGILETLLIIYAQKMETDEDDEEDKG